MTAAIVSMAAASFLGPLLVARAQSATTPGCPGTSIRSPFAGAVISDTIEILGSARIDGFRFYKLEWAPASQPEDWRAVSQVIERSVSNGRLDVWDTRSVPDGRYRLKLTSVDERADERCRFVVEGLIVANRAAPGPVEGPTALPSPTALGRARATSTPVDESPGAEDAADVVPVDEAAGASDGAEGVERTTEEGNALETITASPSDDGGEAGAPTSDSEIDSEETGGADVAGTADEGSDDDPEDAVAEDGEPDSDAEPSAAARWIRSVVGSFVLAFVATALIAFFVLAYRARNAGEGSA